MIHTPVLRVRPFLLFTLILQLVSAAIAEEKIIRISVIDSDTKRAIPARIYLNSKDGTPFYFSAAQEGGSAEHYTKQSRVNDQSVEHQFKNDPNEAEQG